MFAQWGAQHPSTVLNVGHPTNLPGMVEEHSGSLKVAAIVGALLRAARGEKTQEWVAEASGLGLRTVGNLERGESEGRPYNIAAYANVVGLKAKDLETVGRSDAARELDALRLATDRRLTQDDRRLLADMRAKRRTFETPEEWIAWVRRHAPELIVDAGKS